VKLTSEQRYRQAITLSRRIGQREIADLLAGKIDSTTMSGYDRDRAYLIRELDRAWKSGYDASRRALAESEGR
jgi:hypothetical protein